MTDLEITKRCAEAMKDESAAALEFLEEGHRGGYEPLHDDAQAMALVKKFELLLGKREPALNFGNDVWGVRGPSGVGAQNIDLNRAICLCVAKMGAAK